MKDSVKQRILWIAIALTVSGAIVASANDASVSFLTKLLSAGQSAEQAGGSSHEIIRGLVPVNPVRFFLYALLSFSLYYAFEGLRIRFFPAIGASCLLAALDSARQAIAGQSFHWQDILISLGGGLVGVGLAALVLFLLRTLKQRFKKNEEHARLERILDALSLAAVLHYAVFRFLQATMFQLYYSNRYKTLTMLLLIFLGGIRFVYLVLKKCWTADHPRTQTFFLLRCFFAFCLAIPFVLVGWMHDYKALVFLPVCCMCLYAMAPEKVCRAFCATIGICLAALILCCLTGTVRNLVDTQKQQLPCSFGVINSTDFASYFTFLFLIAWCGMKTKKRYAGVVFALLIAIATYVVYLYTDSKTGILSGVLTVFFVLLDCVEEKMRHRNKATRILGKGIDWLSVFAFPAIGVSVIFLTARFAAQDTWAVQLNEALTGRLKTVLTPFQTYGLKPFGNSIEKMYGYGRTLLGTYWSAGYTYLDVTYAMLAVRYGGVITAIVTGLWMWMSIKALHSGKRRFAYSMAVLAVHAFSEARFLDVNYNIFLIMPFCAFASEEHGEEKDGAENGKPLRSLLVGSALIGAISLTLPQTLSVLRTFFYLKGWNAGTAAFVSFAFCAGLAGFIWLFWKTISRLVGKRDKISLVSLAAVLLVLGGSILSINGTIESGRKNRADQLRAEEKTIHEIQAVATEPIYAAECEELYKREGIALPGHLFSTEELGRKPGSILVDQNIEAFGITLSGGQYTQISENTGLYSYDRAVIDYLSDAGYRWTDFYSGKRHCNLQDTALFNNMRTNNGQLDLNNSARIVTKNMENDQFSGVYQVIYTLSRFSTNRDDKGVLFQVLGEGGDRILIQEMLTEPYFDDEGRCERILPYRIKYSPLVSYEISVPEGVSVTVEDISWQRIE